MFNLKHPLMSVIPSTENASVGLQNEAHFEGFGHLIVQTDLSSIN